MPEAYAPAMMCQSDNRLHFWLRIRPWYPLFQPYLLGVALLLPVLSALGFVAGGRELA